MKEEFMRRAIALSVDPVDSHLKWIDDINETQKTRVNFPIIADADRKVSGLYDLIHQIGEIRQASNQWCRLCQRRMGR